jgi:hypothetical protein
MSLGTVLLGIWLVLVGLDWANLVVIGSGFLGFWALVTGVIWLVEIWHPFNLRRP